MGTHTPGKRLTNATNTHTRAQQSGFLSILYSIGSKPLQIWEKHGMAVRNWILCGHSPSNCSPSFLLARTRALPDAMSLFLLAFSSRDALPSKSGLAFPRSLTTASHHNSDTPAPFAAGTGHIKRITDDSIQSLVVEVAVANEQEIPDTYIACPADPRKTLGIKLPFLVMSVKNMEK